MCASVRDGEDLDSQGEGSSQPDTISLASRTSQNTLDSDKVKTHWTRPGSLSCLLIFCTSKNTAISAFLPSGIFMHHLGQMSHGNKV